MHLPSIRRSFISILFLFACSVVVFGQYQERALERARSVKMLTDDRSAVRKIFHDFNLDDSDETSDEFSFGNTQVEVSYSSGGCSEDDGEEIWNIAAGRVVAIRIEDYSELKLADLRINLVSLMKEQVFANDDDQFMFYSKTEGIAVRVDSDEVESIDVFPSVKSKAKTCKNDFAKEFIGEKSWFGKSKLKDRNIISCAAANVTDLTLSHDEISAVTAKQIDVATIALDQENDILTYVYNVSGGRIIGTGPKVQWDLTGVASGSYTILAGVDDGCGLCGATMTKTVVVK